MRIAEKNLYKYTNEVLAWILPAANLALGIYCIIYTLQTQNIW